MRNFARLLREFINDDSAPTTVEYALILGGITLLVAGAVYLVGGRVADVFSRAAETLR